MAESPTKLPEPPAAGARELANRLRERFPQVLSEPAEFRGEITMELSAGGRLVEIGEFLRAELGFDFLVDISSVDHYGDDPRFTLVYHFYGLEHRQYLRLKLAVSEETAEAPTLTTLWATANWHEREIFDMMGIRFGGHPDLRRILMWEGYPYHPLRKDFPISGKETHLPEIAFTNRAPIEGGPFVTLPGGKDAIAREPRVRLPDADHDGAAARPDPGHDSGQPLSGHV